MANILVVDDELGIRDLLSEILNDEGHSVDLAENATQARTARAGNTYDLVLLDIWMPDTDGVSLLKEWATAGVLTMPVIMMSGHATIDTAVEATRIGAFSFLEKPITLQKLLKAVEQGLARNAAHQSAPVAAAPVAAPAGSGASAFTEVPHSSMRRTIARRLAESKSTIPHFYLTVECRMERLLALRKEINASAHADMLVALKQDL